MVSGAGGQIRPMLRWSANCSPATATTSNAIPRPSIGPPPSGAGREGTEPRPNSAIAPIGALTAKIQRHEARSVMTPPSSGPSIGPAMIVAPQIASMRPCSCFG